jgi:hypothetical protein
MTLKRAEHSFRFRTQINLVELTGRKACDVRELLDHLKTLPDSAIYYHTHHFLIQHQFLSPEPPNDFAYWVGEVLNERLLGEQLAGIDTVQFTSIQALRDKLIQVLETYLAQTPPMRIASAGEELYFMKSRGFVLQTPYEAWTLQDFKEAVQNVSIHSLYHHIFEARLRLKRGIDNDFSLWLDKELGEQRLASALTRLDPYTATLEAVRRRIVDLTEGTLRRTEKSKGGVTVVS